MLKKYLLTFLVAMVPIVELRGAIPIGVAWGLPVVPCYIIAVLGNMIPVPFIYFFARKLLVWGSDKKLTGRFFRLPGTGAWTGTLAASILDIGFKKSVAAVMLGVLIAGVIMGVGSSGVLALVSR